MSVDASRTPASKEGNSILAASEPLEAKPSRVPLANILTFGAAGVPITALGLVYTLYLPRFYVGLGLSFVAVSAALADALIDISLDPLVALFVDRTKTVIGRYRPWILAGAPLTMLGAYRLLNPPGDVSTGYLTLWFMVGAAGTSMMSVGIAAWLSVVSTNYNDRSRLYGLQMQGWPRAACRPSSSYLSSPTAKWSGGRRRACRSFAPFYLRPSSLGSL